MGPLIGKLYQEAIIGCDVRDTISASHTRVEQARVLLNYLECQPASLLFKYIEILEESAKSDGLACHAEIARELKRRLPDKENSKGFENCNLQVYSSHDDNDVSRHSSTLELSTNHKHTTPSVHDTPPSDSMPFQFNPIMEHHTPLVTDFNLQYPGPSPLISADSDDSSSDYDVSLTEGNRLTANGIHPPEAIRRVQLPAGNQCPIMSRLTAPDVIPGKRWSNRRRCVGDHHSTHSDGICHLDELSSSSEDNDLSLGSGEEDNEATTKSNSASHDQLHPQEITFLFNRKRHVQLLKANAHQREFMKLWKIYIKDIERAKQCVKYILRDPTNS